MPGPTIAAAMAAVMFLAPESTAPSTAPSVASAPAPAAADEFPEDWFWRQGPVASAHRAMVGKPPPELVLSEWSGDADAIDAIVGKDRTGDIWKNLKGNVVVVDFWATWCGPCRAAIPENVELMRAHAADGLVILAVHDARRGKEGIPEMITARGINYPVAVDVQSKSARAWNVGFWPTYAVIDRKGVVRAVGLQPPRVRGVVEKLLKEPVPKESAAPAAKEGGADAPKTGDGSVEKRGEEPAKGAGPDAAAPTPPASAPDAATPKKPLPRALLEGDPRRREALAKLDLCPEAPSLGAFTRWTPAGEAVGKATSLAELKGKIVVLDFWATWCAPCMASIPKINELAKKYADRGVVFVGVCNPQGGERMLETVRAKGIEYTVCLDTRGEAIANYMVNGYPDYYLIDRDGHLRGADVINESLESAIRTLLIEQPAKTEAPREPGTGDAPGKR